MQLAVAVGSFTRRSFSPPPMAMASKSKCGRQLAGLPAVALAKAGAVFHQIPKSAKNGRKSTYFAVNCPFHHRLFF